ncbi:hypothetical protein H310_12899 [Aphanomyces invadans]|uniref:WW domain-containing protein n=1 Tax=Aphanomyces invadans TaxID=157072 RepID=A0A024THQ5_9STRA|nr:hypothetical protein H310_12899 [Aphanomyces invadans]ETV92862.1 hypothetical protein H310_12899 [Aphanomyces invadans]|eukprot:XP_008878383.1 hypothetical protein H310_12899 [Aphanomyces invadans]
MDRFVKCPSCNVNIPKQDLREVDGDMHCTVCKARLPSEVLSSAASASTALKTITKRRWVELKSKRGRTYYHNNDTGEDRWDMPPDFAFVSTVNAADDAATMVNFKNDDPVRNAILLQQNKQEARKQGVAEDVIETLAAKVAAEQAGNSLQGQLAALEKAQKAAKETKTVNGPPPAPAPALNGTPKQHETTASQASSCTLM